MGGGRGGGAGHTGARRGGALGEALGAPPTRSPPHPPPTPTHDPSPAPGELNFNIVGVIFQLSSIVSESIRLVLVQILLQVGRRGGGVGVLVC